MPPAPPPLPRFHKKVNLEASPKTCSSRNISLKKKLLPKLSFKNITTISDVIIPAASRLLPQEKSSITRPWPLTKMLTKMTTPSRPFTPIGHSDVEHGLRRSGGSLNLQTQVHEHIRRSKSVPILNENSMNRRESFFRLIPTGSRVKDFDGMTPTHIPTDDDDDANGDDIAEEDAVCRIFLVELCEGGETLKMECSCKDVENLPVILQRIQKSARNRDNGVIAAPDLHVEVNAYNDIYMVWQEMPILVVVSTLAYFCFLEHFLVGKMGLGSIALSLPFSCVLGVLSSMTSSAMGKLSTSHKK
ncbi:hypothetical protein SSX86_012763 [Deinandra increscens subsp. villosa]|uniref:Uncharacterized protein n=1 Tax=Deinandra increscens subsp. villosa TaxID=3103831 RepID=A0AAP0DCG6_9ASTR